MTGTLQTFGKYSITKSRGIFLPRLRAGGGNRTRASCLGSKRSTTELHPHNALIIRHAEMACQARHQILVRLWIFEEFA